MKQNFLIFTVFLGIAVSTKSQNWETNGNSLSGTEVLGTTNGFDLNFITSNVQKMTLKTDGRLGLGIANPRGKHEILFCPPAGGQESGLIVTKKNCNALSIIGDPALPDIIGGGIFELYPGGEPPAPDPNIAFVLPFNFLTGHSTNETSPLYTNSSPLFWARTQDDASSPFYTGPSRFDTKMIVMPDGSVGINIAKPRAALDVRGSQFANRPAAIFGSRALGTGGPSGPNGLQQYYTQQIQIIPILSENGYNRISQTNDQGIFFSDGKGSDGANLNGALILAPWANNNDGNIGGLRMDKFGNVEIHGDLRATKMKVEVKWWSDFVFNANYQLMPLYEVEKYIIKNKRLPEIPSEGEVFINGVDLAEMQAKLLQKVEELTLYIIQQKKEIDMLNTKIEIINNHKQK